MLEADGDEPVTSETRFQTASINKSVSAMAVLHLVQEGTLDLETTPFPPSRRCHRARPVALAGEGLRSLQNVAVSAPAIDSDSPTISLLGKAD